MTGDIEKYGSGYVRVREEIADYPTMVFDYQEVGDAYLVALKYDDQKIAHKIAHKTAHKTTREMILDLLQSNPKMTRQDLAEVINVTANVVKHHIAQLKKDGLLERIGGKREGHWIVKRNC